MINGNLYRLIKPAVITHGFCQVRELTPQEEAEFNLELQQAWEQLYTEYSELSGNKQHKYYFALYKSVYAMKLKMHIAQLILTDPQINLDDLHALGYKGDVKSIVARLKFETIELQTKEKELKRMTDKQTGTIKESDFDEWIVSVGKYLGYQIKRKEMILSEFLAANKAMTREIDAKNKARKR
jgi:hypothetical protein